MSGVGWVGGRDREVRVSFLVLQRRITIESSALFKFIAPRFSLWLLPVV